MKRDEIGYYPVDSHTLREVRGRKVSLSTDSGEPLVGILGYDKKPISSINETPSNMIRAFIDEQTFLTAGTITRDPGPSDEHLWGTAPLNLSTPRFYVSELEFRKLKLVQE